MSMENYNFKGKENPLENLYKLGEMLSKARAKINKTASEAAKQLGYTDSANVYRWERGEEIPPEGKLSAISEIYQIGMEELKEAFDLSKQDREKEKQARKSYKKAQLIAVGESTSSGRRVPSHTPRGNFDRD